VPKLDDELKARARSLRTNQSPAETRLWAALRAHRFGGVKFARQVIVEPYILDFAARQGRVAIELDGDTHAARSEYDARRTAFLERQGYRVIRFTNADVMGNLEGVLAAIGVALRERTPPLPNPSPRRGEGL
jgi:very-short-patch-repair endonuclease